MSLGSKKHCKILILFYEPFLSGISRHIRYLLQVVKDENIEFWLLCSSDDQKIPAFLADVVPKDHLTMVQPSRFFSLEGLVTARKIIQKNHIDLVHIHNLQSAIWGYGSTFFTRCKKIIFTPHVDSFGENSNYQGSRYLLKLLSPFTAFFIAVSSSQQNRFKHWKIAHTHKIQLIRNHIDTTRIETCSQSHSNIVNELNIPSSSVIVMQIGRLDRQKNPLSLLRIIKEVTKRCNNSHFLFIGDGPLRKKLEIQIKRDNMMSHVTLLGYRKNIHQLTKTVDIITSTSRWEGLPYSLIEASFFKKAIVATDIPGHSDLINTGTSGFLVKNEQEFADKLCKLIQSKTLRTTMGENFYRRNKELFSIENMRNSLSEIYTNS
ncbi:glycosyltransferase [Desulfocapsa sulfexigens DSM 10523]|uniref:Glycosyltransferase n=1 Tax=Desulfocapsa sulfexigens (strain DSM 10523 / SB164P1) TaxID=1167006 RepID=M1PA91_DESSD|nr:glycosyltransferase [Desulfocapsa sulfexigens DSM 10523]